MTEYTWDDIIINPNSEEAKNAIEKECYFSKRPFLCLQHANENDESFLGIVESSMEKDEPFSIEDGSNWTCIIVKKEEPKPKYIPFESMEEFMKAYGNHTHPDKDSGINNALDMSSMWLINTRDERPAVEQVIAVRDKSVSFRKAIYTYAGLFEFFTFPDGTPCGKLREESDA